jgi:hypothetical protein
MTMKEMAAQENKAVKHHWRVAVGYSWEITTEEQEIMNRIPENWYGPEKKPRQAQ